MGFTLQKFEPDLGTSVIWQNADNTKRIAVFAAKQLIYFDVANPEIGWQLVEKLHLPATESAFDAVIEQLDW